MSLYNIPIFVIYMRVLGISLYHACVAYVDDNN